MRSEISFKPELLVGILVLFYAFYPKDDAKESNSEVTSISEDSGALLSPYLKTDQTRDTNVVGTINLWCIFTKVNQYSNLTGKFAVFAESVLDKTSEPIVLSVITDEVSRPVAEGIIGDVQKEKRFLEVAYLDVSVLAEKLKRIVSIMSPHFSSKPGTYYSDALFFLSLGLHHIVGADQQKVIMTDIDIKFVGDIAELWTEFNKFSSNAIVGIGPELSPTYRNVFRYYRASNPGTKIGEPLNENGFPGLNSGVLILNLARMRQSKIFAKFIGDDIPGNPRSPKEIQNWKEGINGSATSVDSLVKKYSFVSHLGDQDFYTLLKVEYPELIHIMPCIWNRQLCTWWRDEGGYGDVFDKYYRCDGQIKIYHGNCNTSFPDHAGLLQEVL